MRARGFPPYKHTAQIPVLSKHHELHKTDRNLQKKVEVNGSRTILRHVEDIIIYCSSLECDHPGINEGNIISEKTTVGNFMQTSTINKPPDEYPSTQATY